MVETVGIEPMTSCMSSMRSNQLSYASATHDIIAYAEAFVKGFLKSFFEKLKFFCCQKQAHPKMRLLQYPIYAQLMVVGFSSKMQISFRKFTALARPSSMVMMLSSCSMDSTRS